MTQQEAEKALSTPLPPSGNDEAVNLFLDDEVAENKIETIDGDPESE